MRSLRRLAVLTTGLTVTLITIGATVRATGSGLGCPDWPKCHGRWIPPMEFEPVLEYSHRLTAALVGVLVLVLALYAWARFRSLGSVVWPSAAALAVVVVQGGIGRVVVERELKSELVALHFGVALTLVALLVVVSVNSFTPRGGHFGEAARTGLIAAASVAAVLMLGALVTQWGAALVFPDWPLMEGRLLPDSLGAERLAHLVHRLGALLLGVVLTYTAVRATRRHRDNRILVGLAHSALAIWAIQVALGAANIITRSATWAVVLHVLFGALLWVTVVALTATGYRGSRRDEGAAPGPGERPLAETVKAYFALTKPRIIELLLITTVPAMVVAGDGWPSTWLVVATLIGGSLAAGSANGINCYLDRDIDARMERTSGRPLPQLRVEPLKALAFGVTIGLVGVGWLAVIVNPAAALLALAAILFYVFVYTMWLKRATSSNIVIGGAAGAVPVLVGWAAVTGTIGLEALVLFAIIFYWTPPHFWALALRYAADYRRAEVPMLPVVRGAAETTAQMLLYSMAMISLSLGFYPVARMGVVYLSASILAGALFGWQAIRLHRGAAPDRAMSVFRGSIVYLTVLFAAMAVDRIADAPRYEALYPVALLLASAGFAASKAMMLFGAARRRVAIGRRRLGVSGG